MFKPDWFSCALTGFDGRSLRRHSVLHGGARRPPVLVQGPDSQWDLQPGDMQQPPCWWCHFLVGGIGGAPRRAHRAPLRALPLRNGARHIKQRHHCPTFFETLGNFNTFGKLIPLTPPPLLCPDFHHGGVIAQVQPRAADGQQIIFCFFLSVFLAIPVGFLCLPHLHAHFLVVALSAEWLWRLQRAQGFGLVMAKGAMQDPPHIIGFHHKRK